MTRDEKTAEAHRLAGEGWNNRQIAERLGVASSAVWGWRNPERLKAKRQRDNASRAAAKRAWDRENWAKCVDCGGDTSETPKRGIPAPRCNDCRRADDARRIAERAHQIEQWWAEGLSLKEIAARLDWSLGYVGVEFDRLRAKGFNLPYRRKLSRPRYESQVAA